jgi:hypothetical protein
MDALVTRAANRPYELGHTLRIFQRRYAGAQL